MYSFLQLSIIDCLLVTGDKTITSMPVLKIFTVFMHWEQIKLMKETPKKSKQMPSTEII